MQLYEIHKSCITEEVIWAYDGQKADANWFVFHLFLLLRAHADLLENADYKRLHDECAVYLNKYMNQNKAFLGLEYTDYREDLAALCDSISDSEEASKMRLCDAERFLDFRRRAWSS